MNDLILDSHSEDIIYALGASPNFAKDSLCFAARKSGLHLSQDGGLSWQSAFNGLNTPVPPSATAVAVSPSYLTDRTLFVGVPGGMLSTGDGGTSWNASPLPTPAPFITVLAVSPNYAHDGIVLAGSLEDGVFLSEDYGRSWNGWNFGLLDQNILSLAISPDFSRDGQVFAGTESGIYRSQNRGRSWRPLNFPVACSTVLSLALSPAFAEDTTIWAGTESGGLLYSENGGDSWEQIGLEGSVNNLIIDNNDMLVLFYDELVITRDRGKSWAKLEINPGKSCILVIAPYGLQVGKSILLVTETESITTTVLTH